jgi:hypothetical protein
VTASAPLAAVATTEIHRVLERYFDGLHQADPGLLAEVFHQSSMYATAVGGTLLLRTLPEYLAVVEAREAPASRGETRTDAVDAILLAGPETALASVRCSVGGRRFVDLLTLVRADGRWQILSKVFHYDEVA